MLIRKYYDIKFAPVKISWDYEIVQDMDAGDFYVKMNPHVDYADDMITVGTWGTSVKQPDTSVPLHLKGGFKRQEIAEQGRRISAELNKEILKDTQMRLRAEYNKRRGQRWNKKV